MGQTRRMREIAARTFLMRKADIDDLYFDNFAVFGRPMQKLLFTAQLRSQISDIDPYAAYHEALSTVGDLPLVSQLLYADSKTYLHELLMKQDQMSMAASIESRVPFLDHPFAEWVARLPQNLKLRGTTTKWILREAMKDKLPSEILSRKKMGFPVPIGAWLRGDWKHLLTGFVTSDRALGRGYFEPSYVRRIVGEHLTGVNHNERMWALLNFEIWSRIFIDGDAPSSIDLTRDGKAA
jgi:asparagine synthase (glutamine-hydrolysing)